MAYFISFICNGTFISVFIFVFLASVEGLFCKPKYRANIFNCLYFSYVTSVSISSSCRKEQFSVLTYYLKICTDPGLRRSGTLYWFVVVV